MPQLYLLIILASIITPSFWILLVFLLLFSWMSLTGVVRAEFLRGRNLEYVRAAQGARRLRHAADVAAHPAERDGRDADLPALHPVGLRHRPGRLDFLGFGLPPGSPSLGELLAQGKNNLQAPWLGFTAFVVLGGVLTLLIFVGEAVRDAFDPRKLPH